MWHADGPYFPAFLGKAYLCYPGGCFWPEYSLLKTYIIGHVKAHDRPLLGPLLHLLYWNVRESSRHLCYEFLQYITTNCF